MDTFRLMLSAAVCTQEHCFSVTATKRNMVLKDSYEKEFSMRLCLSIPWKTGTTDKEEYCYNILYNSISLWTSERMLRK
ncbi:MAG: hypothetical protein ACLRVD_00725 [Blautia caecimuris]